MDTTPTANTDVQAAIERLGISLGVRLLREIEKHNPERVLKAIAAFEQYRARHPVTNPSGCLLQMIRDGAEPNMLQETPAAPPDEFNHWYQEAVAAGFCLDVPRRLLGTIRGEPLVKVTDERYPQGYRVMLWRDAQVLWDNLRRGR
ncbi:MAG: hypothetical protein NZ482_08385 [Gloeomargarita sp. SKYG98]|nr:hypothetical protein [Gloeomargarita sp. SKYG98]